jgi:hypothetical protein
MSISGFGRCALSSCVAVAMLAGCGGSQPTIGAPGAMAQTAPSHIRKASSSYGDLLYVGSESYGIFVLTYPQGKVVAQFEPPNPLGMCSDQSGDVFVLWSDGAGYIDEYAHGGTTPIATLEMPMAFPRHALSIRRPGILR